MNKIAIPYGGFWTLSLSGVFSEFGICGGRKHPIYMGLFTVYILGRD